MVYYMSRLKRYCFPNTSLWGGFVDLIYQCIMYKYVNFLIILLINIKSDLYYLTLFRGIDATCKSS